MRAPSSVVDALEWLGSLSRGQAVARGAVIAAGAGFALCASRAGGGSAAFTTLVIALSALAAVRADGSGGLALLVACAGGWTLTVDTVVNGWTLAAAGCLLASHSALSAAATTEPSGPLTAAAALRYAVQSAGVMLACTAGWLAILIVRGSDARGHQAIAVTGLLGAVGLIALVWRLGFAAPPAQPPPPR